MSSSTLIFIPFKDSLKSLKFVLSSLEKYASKYSCILVDDFSTKETLNTVKQIIKQHNEKCLNDEKTERENHGNFLDHWKLIRLKDYTDSNSPNYGLALKIALKESLKRNMKLLVLESDVFLLSDKTIPTLEKILEENLKIAMIGSLTIGPHPHEIIYAESSQEYQKKYEQILTKKDELSSNFPYGRLKDKMRYRNIKLSRWKIPKIFPRKHLSFCCTLISMDFEKTLMSLDFSSHKWYDLISSRLAYKNNFKLFVETSFPVLHLPHSSRPEKKLKYRNPMSYYIAKIKSNV